MYDVISRLTVYQFPFHIPSLIIAHNFPSTLKQKPLLELRCILFFAFCSLHSVLSILTHLSLQVENIHFLPYSGVSLRVIQPKHERKIKVKLNTGLIHVVINGYFKTIQFLFILPSIT